MSADWDHWLAEHGPALLLLARQHVDGHADAEEAVQEGFLRFWPRRQRAADPKAFLFGCVRRAALDVCRRDRRRALREKRSLERRPELGDAFCPAGRSVEEREEQAVLIAALERLPIAQREVVVLKVWGESTFEQIGTVLGISANTAASRYRYGLSKLRDFLGPEEER